MIFLLEYDRQKGRIVTIEAFRDADRKASEKLRLQLEMELNLKNVENEVVLLEAASEAALRRTHRRYFENLAELTTAPA